MPSGCFCNTWGRTRSEKDWQTPHGGWWRRGMNSREGTGKTRSKSSAQNSEAKAMIR